MPLANDTSIGVGHAPLSALERLVLTLERHINAREHKLQHLAWGEDVKVMGVRCGNNLQLTVACAMIDRYFGHIDDYLAEKAKVRALAATLAEQHSFASCDVCVNAADDPRAGNIYITVTGTSAEAGDDGQVGRGNRVNGLITPCRPMSLEAAAGKNPVTHVGKIYNVIARDIAEAAVAAVPGISGAHCMMVSRIGSPVMQPAIVQIKLAIQDDRPIDEFKQRVDEIAMQRIANIPNRIEDFIAGRIAVA